MRNVSPEKKSELISLVINSLSPTKKMQGMIDYKLYLVRSHLDLLKLSQSKKLLDFLERKVRNETKNNILVHNFNVVRSACQIIEVLHLISQNTESLKVRCLKLREEIVELVKEYMTKVES